MTTIGRFWVTPEVAKHFRQSPETLGAEHVRDYLLYLKNVRKVQTNTILVNRSALRFLYVNTLKQTWFDDQVPMPKRRPGLPGQLSAEEITRILDHTTNLKHWTIIATFYATALRCDELRNLKVCDIDSKRMVIFVRQAKGGVPREIPLSPVLLERLRVYFRWRRPTDWLFPSKQRQDSPLEDASITSAVQNGRSPRRYRPSGPPAPVPACLRHPHARCRC